MQENLYLLTLLTETQLLQLLQRLSNEKQDKLLSIRYSNALVDHFTFHTRIETKGYKGISFKEFLSEIENYKSKAYIQGLLNFYRENRPNTPTIKALYRIFTLYFGAINIFKPSVTLYILRATGLSTIHMLDPTMGWGGRLIGAAACRETHSYTGFDTNIKLRKNYEEMIKLVRNFRGPEFKVSLHFTDALKVDYSKFKYNVVLTSPPYYETEIYEYMNFYGKREKKTRGKSLERGIVKQSKKKGGRRKTHRKIEGGITPSKPVRDAWNKEFYEPLFHKTYTHLQRDGWFCINVPYTVVEDVLEPFLGPVHLSIPIGNSVRFKDMKKVETCYCWKKP